MQSRRRQQCHRDSQWNDACRHQEHQLLGDGDERQQRNNGHNGFKSCSASLQRIGGGHDHPGHLIGFCYVPSSDNWRPRLRSQRYVSLVSVGMQAPPICTATCLMRYALRVSSFPARSRYSPGAHNQKRQQRHCSPRRRHTSHDDSGHTGQRVLLHEGAVLWQRRLHNSGSAAGCVGRHLYHAHAAGACCGTSQQGRADIPANLSG